MTDTHNRIDQVVEQTAEMPLCPATGSVCYQALRLSELYDTHPSQQVVGGLSQTDSAEFSKDSIKLHVQLADLSENIGRYGCSGAIDGHCPVPGDAKQHTEETTPRGFKRVLKVIGI